MTRPNVIVFLTDDQGYGDLSCMGARDSKTPHIDALAASGARLTSYYSNAPVCSPARAALLTGRYPGNAGVRSILGGRRTTPGLPGEVPTLARALKSQGYQTAMFGKWHLGLAEGSRPHDHGFDEWFGFLAGCIDYYSHIFYWGIADGKMDPIHDLWHNDQEIYENGKYFTEMITDRAVEYIRRAASDDKPFFLYIPYNAPHYPMHAPQKYLDRFSDLPWERKIMAAMLSAVDDSVGAIMDEVKRQGLYQDTFCCFQSDNGPSRESRNWLDGTSEPYYGGSQGPLKGHKFSLFEGGIRVPGIFSWPGTIPSDQVIDQPAAFIDLFPTVAGIAGVDLVDYELDGLDIIDMLTKSSPSPHSEIFWEIGGQTAVRSGKWKLVLNGQLVEDEPSVFPVHLADVEEDMGERHNLKDEYPDVVRELEAKCRKWRQGIENRWKDYWQPRIDGVCDRVNEESEEVAVDED